MIKFISKICAFLLVFCLTACDTSNGTAQQSENSEFTVTCSVAANVKKDSATLYIVDECYNRLECHGLRTLNKQRSFTWKGDVNEPKAAFICFANDSLPLYFVVEPGNINISLSRTERSIKGGRSNSEYMSFISHRTKIIKAKDNLFKKYQSCAADSTLTAELEQDFLKQDSLLSDSIQRYTAHRIAAGGPVATIVKERFFNTLTEHYMKKQ